MVLLTLARGAAGGTPPKLIRDRPLTRGEGPTPPQPSRLSQGTPRFLPLTRFRAAEAFSHCRPPLNPHSSLSYSRTLQIVMILHCTGMAQRCSVAFIPVFLPSSGGRRDRPRGSAGDCCATSRRSPRRAGPRFSGGASLTSANSEAEEAKDAAADAAGRSPGELAVPFSSSERGSHPSCCERRGIVSASGVCVRWCGQCPGHPRGAAGGDGAGGRAEELRGGCAGRPGGSGAGVGTPALPAGAGAASATQAEAPYPQTALLSQRSQPAPHRNRQLESKQCLKPILIRLIYE